jgi:hypothetical protein
MNVGTGSRNRPTTKADTAKMLGKPLPRHNQLIQNSGEDTLPLVFF